MALSVQVFQAALEELPATTEILAAQQNHAAAFRQYMSGLTTVPPLLPVTHIAAEAAMIASLTGQHLPPPAGVQAINAGYLTYVGVLLAALAAQTWAVSVPPNPAGPIDLEALSGSFTIEDYVTYVHDWVTAIRGSVPPAPPVPWA
jgi:hypothetical protein